MKKFLLCFLITMGSLCIPVFNFACNCDVQENSFVPYEKIYIFPDQIKLFENKIFVKMENEIIRTSAIYVEAQGFYFKDYYQGDCPDGYWECPNKRCKECNPSWYTCCPLCGTINWKIQD